MVVSNRNLLFQGSIFKGYVSFREGKYTSPMDGMENVGTPTSHSNSSSTTVAGSAAEA